MNDQVRTGPSSPSIWMLVVVLLVVILIVYYALMEHFAPISSDAYVQSYVVQIAPQVGGQVSAVKVTDNHFVKQGALLFALDPRPYQYRVDQLEAALVLAKHQVDQLENLRQVAQAHVESAKADLANAQWHVDERKKLLQTGNASRETVQDALDRVDNTKASLNLTQAELAKIENQIAAQIVGEHALIKRAQAELAQARYDLEQTQVRAPFDGYVTNLQLTPGFFIEKGRPAMSLVDDSQRWLVANLRENSLALVQSGLEAEFTIAMYPGEVFPTRVESLAWGVYEGQGEPSGLLPAIDPPANWVRVAQRFPVRLKIPSNQVGVTWRVGSSVTVVIYTRRIMLVDSLSALWLRIGSYLNYLL